MKQDEDQFVVQHFVVSFARCSLIKGARWSPVAGQTGLGLGLSAV